MQNIIQGHPFLQNIIQGHLFLQNISTFRYKIHSQINFSIKYVSKKGIRKNIELIQKQLANMSCC